MELTPKQKHVLYNIVKDIRSGKPQVAMGGFAGTGKAQPLYSKVYTPTGPVEMSNISIGDLVCTPDGGSAIVIGIYPQGKKQVVRFYFDDNSSVDSCIDHLWSVIDRTKLSNLKKFKTGYRVYSTAYIVSKLQLQQGSNRFYIPGAICNFVSKEVPIDPYLIGVIIGDGTTKGNFRITTKDAKIKSDIEEILSKIGCQLRHVQKCDYNIVGNNNRRGKYSSSKYLRDHLRTLDLWGKGSREKFIPSIYKQNSMQVRLAVLQGLMDTDGTISRKTGMASLSTTSLCLANDVIDIVGSIGGKATIKPKKTFWTYKNKRRECDSFVVNIRLNNTKSLFRLDRKRVLAKNRTKYKVQRCIKKAEILGEIECKCIAIDHPNHLYVTDNYIATHNTTLAKYIAKFFPNFGVCAYTGKAANVLRKKGMENARTIHSLIYRPVMEYGQFLGFDLATHDQLNCSGFIVDEGSMVGEDIYEDLQSYNFPMIIIGDHGQLEPVNSNFNLMETPDYILEEIHRNAGNIAKFAEFIRLGKNPKKFPRCKEIEYKNQKNITSDDFLAVDQVICAFNRTRVETNNIIREACGYNGLINVGERVMCLKNNRTNGLYNGMQGIVRNLYEDSRTGRKMMDFESDGTIIEGVWYDTKHFGKEKVNIEYFGGGAAENPNPFDYAYCITAHKAQGDEWDRVMVLEQRCKLWDHIRWFYTATSRARVGLVVGY
jgi:hypothetical protein